MDEFAGHLPHRRRVAVHDGGGCCDVAVGVEALPVEDVAGIAGELLEEGAPGPAIALAEWMDGVHFAEVIRQSLGERVAGKAAHEVLVVQCPEDVCRRGLDVLRQAEPGSLRDGDGAELPGPALDVAEDPAVDRAQVPQVVAGRDR